MNLQTRTMPTGEPAPSAPPPSPAELEEKFPQFEILECLGRGGMGVVYKARQKALDRIVAIKILAGEWQDAPGFAERFEKEAKLLAKLNHPHIVTIHDFGKAGELYYIVMEYVDGVNVRDLLRDGRLESKQALAIVPPICDALQFAHDHGVVHRDIKPENILLDRDGRVKIADFGIATIAGDAADRAGTPAYMAPEQARHEAAIDHRADIYALGVVLYEMLTGERPGQGIEVPSKRVQVDVRIDEIVLRALESRPEQRYQSAEEFKTVVETVAAAPPESPAAASPPVAPEAAEVSDVRERDGRFAWIALLLTFVGTPFLLGMVSPWQEGAVLFLGVCFAIASMVFAIRARRSRAGKTVLGIWCGLVVIMTLLFAVYMARQKTVVAQVTEEMGARKREIAERQQEAAQAGPVRIRVRADGSASLGGRVLATELMLEELKKLAAAKPERPVMIEADSTVPYSAVAAVLDLCTQASLSNVSFYTETTPEEEVPLPKWEDKGAEMILPREDTGPADLPDPPSEDQLEAWGKMLEDGSWLQWKDGSLQSVIPVESLPDRVKVVVEISAGSGLSLAGKGITGPALAEELKVLHRRFQGLHVEMWASELAHWGALEKVHDACALAGIPSVDYKRVKEVEPDGR
jgi:biopolymer transport protein ExbD/predicted Ser/Thr protein kinase